MIPKLTTERLILREIKSNDIFGYYELFSDPQSMKLYGGPTLANDLEYKDIVQSTKSENAEGIIYFWTITLKEEKEFIGFVRLMSYNSKYYDISFSAIGEYKFDHDFLKYFDNVNGWEIDYALIKSKRCIGIMREAMGVVLEFCESKNLSPIYAKVGSLTNTASVNVLKHHSFIAHMQQINKKLLEKYEIKTIIDNKEFGMIYKWTP